jgi:hypothetical protein
MLPFVEVGRQRRTYEVIESSQRQYTRDGTHVLLLVDHARQTMSFGPDAPHSERAALLTEAGALLPLGWSQVPIVGYVA